MINFLIAAQLFVGQFFQGTFSIDDDFGIGEAFIDTMVIDFQLTPNTVRADGKLLENGVLIQNLKGTCNYIDDEQRSFCDLRFANFILQMSLNNNLDGVARVCNIATEECPFSVNVSLIELN